MAEIPVSLRELNTTNRREVLTLAVIDERHHVRIVRVMIRTAGADELLTSCHADVVGSRAPCYERLGSVPTGDVDDEGETVLRLDPCRPGNRSRRRAVQPSCADRSCSPRWPSS
jgi:hypothetical protein